MLLTKKQFIALLIILTFGILCWYATAKYVVYWFNNLTLDQALQGVFSLLFLITAICMFSIVHIRNKKDMGDKQ